MSGESLNLNLASSRTLTAILLRQSAELDKLLGDLKGSVPDAEFETARSIVGRILGEIYVAALYPIFEKYPGLKPDGFP